MITLNVNATDTDQFVDCWKLMIDSSFVVKPYNEKRGALVFSFDCGMRAFLNNTKGWHKDYKNRPYLSAVPEVFNQIETLLIPYRDTGGRVFIDNERAYFVDESCKRTDLCALSWADERDVVTEVRTHMTRRHAIFLPRVFSATAR